MLLPNPPSGSSPAAAWLRRILDAVRSQRILPGVGYFVKESSNGTVLQINATGGGGSGSLMAGTISALYGTTIASPNYFNVQPVDSTGSAVGITINVAKSPPAWMVASMDGDSYAYTNDNLRSIVGTSPIIQQTVLEPFAVSQLVLYMPCIYTGVNTLAVTPAPVQFMEVRTEREWTEPAPA